MRRAPQTSKTQAADRPPRNAILKLGPIEYRPIDAIREFAFQRMKWFELIREWLQRIGAGLPFIFDHGEVRIFFPKCDRHGERGRRPSIDMQAIHETGLS